MPEAFKIIFVAGARPNFMKIAPIMKAMEEKRREGAEKGVEFKLKIVHTGQHYDTNMSKKFFNELEMPEPEYKLEVGSDSHAMQTAKIMVAFEKVLLEDKPDLVVVVGDVNSTVACSMTAKKLGVRVAHVEAGLRSFDMEMPEEINRILTDRISDFLFVTEEAGIRNLKNEGIPDDRIFFVGNVMIDTLLMNLNRIESSNWKPSHEVHKLIHAMDNYAVLTLHRPSNVDRLEDFQPLWDTVSEVGRRIPVIFPVHPRTLAKMKEFGLLDENIRTIDPIGYLDMLWIVKGARFVLTDSGGLQEETTVLGIPCITIRENTERPSTIEIGTNYLAGTDPSKIVSIADEILQGRVKKGEIPPLWDGKAAERIVEIILREM